MEIKKRTTSKRTASKKKDGVIHRSERLTVNEQVALMLEDYKKKMGEVVCVRVDDRTSIEIPACLTPAERLERIENYKKNVGVRA